MLFEKNVTSISMFEFIDWAQNSFDWLDDHVTGASKEIALPDHGLLALPPVQRSAVWRAKQVVDLWDSVLSGMPIGSFYLIPQQGSPWKGISSEKTIEISIRGFELLDGQQRLRALLAGTSRFIAEKRCLWVDLGAHDADAGFRLRITSKAQPFGYDNQGEKLRSSQRRDARRALECPHGGVEIQLSKLSTGPSPVYDTDLFDQEVYLNQEKICPPPNPFGASKETFKLMDAIKAWRRCASRCDGDRVTAFIKDLNTSSQIDLTAAQTFDKAMIRMREAEVALIRVEPHKTFSDPTSGLLTLFQRIGTGGTTLSADERLYSIYKFYEPIIRDVVEEVHSRVKKVLPATKIAVTAIRIAYAQTSQNGVNPSYSPKAGLIPLER